MKRTLIALLLVVIAASLVLSGCSPKAQFLTLGTGGTTGVYFPIGGSLGQIWQKELKGLTVDVKSTGASVANINMFSAADVKDRADVVIVQNDIAHYAYTGTEMFAGKKVEGIRAIASLYDEAVQIVVATNSGITSVADLKGKRVSVGAAASGTEANARQILEAFGLTYSDMTVSYLNFANSEAGLKDGQLDAFFATTGIGNATIVSLSSEGKATIIPLVGANVANLVAKYPFYSKITIPANTYKNQTFAVETVSVKAILIARADLTEKMVYDLTKALYKNLADLGAAHARGKDVTLANAKVGLTLPVHAGAQKYFTEQKVK
ncbi:MAG: TAXI family TRAP transporter solute-binding subunit [bacterium]|nr:TAXI family TRAP transporter solute-binding subunit [bacterium]